MARTLQQLKESIDNLINQQGPDAPVAAFIFTNEDVFTVDENYDPQYLSIDTAHQVLEEIEGSDYIYEQVFEYIEQEINRIK